MWNTVEKDVKPPRRPSIQPSIYTSELVLPSYTQTVTDGEFWPMQWQLSNDMSVPQPTLHVLNVPHRSLIVAQWFKHWAPQLSAWVQIMLETEFFSPSTDFVAITLLTWLCIAEIQLKGHQTVAQPFVHSELFSQVCLSQHSRTSFTFPLGFLASAR